MRTPRTRLALLFGGGRRVFCSSTAKNTRILSTPQNVQSETERSQGRVQAPPLPRPPAAQVPIEICQLSHLLGLNLGNNRLHSLPWEICGLQSLQALNLGGNQLHELPPSIGRLLRQASKQAQRESTATRQPPRHRLPPHSRPPARRCYGLYYRHAALKHACRSAAAPPRR